MTSAALWIDTLRIGLTKMSSQLTQNASTQWPVLKAIGQRYHSGRGQAGQQSAAAVAENRAPTLSVWLCALETNREELQ